MTIPSERTYAVLATKDFLRDLLTGEIKRIPKEVRQRAGRLLRHYPSDLYIDSAAQLAPDIFARPEQEKAKPAE